MTSISGTENLRDIGYSQEDFRAAINQAGYAYSQEESEHAADEFALSVIKKWPVIFSAMLPPSFSRPQTILPGHRLGPPTQQIR